MGVKQTPEQQAAVRIKNRRAELGMSQEAVAKAMNALGHSWYQTTVTKTEVGGRPLRVNEVHDLAAVLGVPVWDLVGAPQYEMPALRQMFRAQEDVGRLQRHVNELREELDLAVQNLQRAQIYETDAREKLAEMGVVEVDGVWQFPDDGTASG